MSSQKSISDARDRDELTPDELSDESEKEERPTVELDFPSSFPFPHPPLSLFSPLHTAANPPKQSKVIIKKSFKSCLKTHPRLVSLLPPSLLLPKPKPKPTQKTTTKTPSSTLQTHTDTHSEDKSPFLPHPAQPSLATPVQTERKHPQKSVESCSSDLSLSPSPPPREGRKEKKGTVAPRLTP